MCHSSTEAEYVTCSDASRHAEYHVNVLGELGLFEEENAVQIYTDSKGAEALVRNRVQRQRTKHIGTPYDYVRKVVNKGVVNFQRVAYADNAVDDLTKGNSKPFESFACQIFKITVIKNSVYFDTYFWRNNAITTPSS